MRTDHVARVLAVSILLALAGTASARNVTVTIPMENVEVRSGDRGDYYLVRLAVPADVIGKRLDSVLLEFVVDAAPATDAEASLELIVETFPLAADVTRTTPEYSSEVPSIRGVLMGENRKVTVDITDIVKGWITNPTTNHGLIIGSLTGPKLGSLSLDGTALGPDTALRVMFFYQNRFGERISGK